MQMAVNISQGSHLQLKSVNVLKTSSNIEGAKLLSVIQAQTFIHKTAAQMAVKTGFPLNAVCLYTLYQQEPKKTK